MSRLALGVASIVWLSLPGIGHAASPAPPAPTVDPAATTPNVRVVDIRPTFVPSVPDADGDGCSGPYLDLRFTIANLGATYPVADELIETQSLPARPEGFTLLVLQVWTDQSGTGQNMAQANVPVLMTDVPGQLLEPGQSIEVVWRYRVPNDQTSMRFFGEVTGAHYHITTGSTGQRYESTAAIPIWDVRPREAMTVGRKADNGTPEAISLVTFENRGASDTPGPIDVAVNLKYPDVSWIGGWNGRSPFAVPAGGTVQVPGRTTLVGDRALDGARLEVHAYGQALCPDGSFGDLSDGDSTNNGRTLRLNGAPIPAPSGS